MAVGKRKWLHSEIVAGGVAISKTVLLLMARQLETISVPLGLIFLYISPSSLLLTHSGIIIDNLAACYIISATCVSITMLLASSVRKPNQTLTQTEVKLY